jgi:phenylalanyl-tRNA synthetase alpha subunit
MLLMQHNMLIQRLQKEILELKTEVKEVKEVKDKNTSNSNDIDYKSEYLGLLEEMKEMKKVLLKVQSFSMETNLEVMKLKRNADKDSEKMDLSSITITNEFDNVSELHV